MASTSSGVEGMMNRLKLSGLTEAHAKTLRIKPVTVAEAMALGFQSADAGFLIPYFSLNGKPTKFSRIRFFDVKKDPFTGKDGAKYSQLPGTGNQLYLPPLLKWQEIAADAQVPVIITEGELKAACAATHELPTIGLGGVWNFKNGNNRHLDAFNEFNWQDRTVYICYDSDIVLKWQVALAENHLARELLTMGARPHVLRLPQVDDEKTGLDDFLVKKGRAAFDQILADAQEFGPAQELFKLNEEVIYVRDPGLIYIPADGRRISPEAFMRHAYANRVYYEVPNPDAENPKQVKHYAAKEWNEWPFRSEAKRLTYLPGQDKIVSGEINVWPGWGCEPKHGTVKPWRELLDFLFKGVKPEDRKYAEQWLAYPIQYPGTKLYTAMVVWGISQGTGKSTVGYTMRRIYGKNWREIGEPDLDGRFNEWAVNRQFVMGDEIASNENRRSTSDRMKSIITQQTLTVNAKYLPTYTVPDCINYYFTSNHPDAFFMEDQDRRFFVHEVKGAPLPNSFYDSYIKWLDEEGGKEALFFHLLHLDLTGFNPVAAAPITEAKQEMMAMGRSELGNWVNQLKCDPNSVLRLGEHTIGHHLMESHELVSLYDPEQRKRVNAQTMARELKRAQFTALKPVRVRDRIVKLWVVRPLDVTNSSLEKPEKIAAHYRKDRNIPDETKETSKEGGKESSKEGRAAKRGKRKQSK